MCGIGGALSLDGSRLEDAAHIAAVMNHIQEHRGPDGEAYWNGGHVAFAHRRLAIIDLATGDQPMTDGQNWITYNGEVYNYPELRNILGGKYRTTSDTEVILAGYRKWGEGVLDRLRGMFAFALWDGDSLFCARDRFGIKPFYYAVADGVFYLASEAKALLPFVGAEPDEEALADYACFQFYLGGKTPFADIRELQPGHSLTIRNGVIQGRRWWQPRHPKRDLDELLHHAVTIHTRADVPIGAYVSGGMDSSLVASLAGADVGFHGRFAEQGYDESPYARLLGIPLHEVEITQADFVGCIEDVAWHLDYPVAGPGSFPQYLVSQLAAQHRKVVLGGQGGDEVFGGYARYLALHLEQEAQTQARRALPGYEPLLSHFWPGSPAARYFELIARADGYSPTEAFVDLFGVSGSPADRAMRFDLEVFLPSLLHVEDRVSMAHGLESRVPLLDHRLVEAAIAIPAERKLAGGLKSVLRGLARTHLPRRIVERRDKMGFPVPLDVWMEQEGPVRAYVSDTLGRMPETRGRALWGELSLALWRKAYLEKPLAVAA